MYYKVPIETAEAVTILAVDAVREQQDKLQALLDKNRRSLDELTIERARVARELGEVEARTSALEQRLDDDRRSDLAIELVSLSEQQRALKQQQSRIGDVVERLTALSGRLRLAVRRNEEIVASLTDEDIAQSTGDASWRVVQAQEEERQRLAREIHDGPAQVLANAVFELEFCERLIEKNPAKLRRELDRLKEDIRQSLADVRHFIFGLRPTVLSDLGLTGTLRRYAEDYENRCGIVVKLEMPERISVAGAQEVAVFRIVQEALQNARKHSRCSEIELRLCEQGSQLVVTIEDNGEGFDLDNTAERNIGHFGLRGMHERARLIGGKLEIASRPGEGTKVQLVVCRDNFATN